MNSPVWAALFDWDGVIIDSSRHHEESWERLAREENRVLPSDHFKRGFGMKNEWIIPHLLHWTEVPSEIQRLSLRKEALYREVVGEWGIEPLPGVESFLRWLQCEQIPAVIGSSTHRLNIETSLHVMGWKKFFRGMVTAEDVKQGKPAPEVFLRAAALTGLPPERCVVFEDAPVGLQAAHAAGAYAVALTTTHPATTLTDADSVVDRLDVLDHAFFQQLFK